MLESINLKFKKLDNRAILPTYANPGDAGMDFYSLERYFLRPGLRVLVRTGLSVEIPEGYELQIRPRSGLAIKNGLSLVNSPGTIDSGYRGEIGLIVINQGGEDFTIEPGMKIAQGVLARYSHANITEVAELSETQRGAGGFGSTGLH